MNPIFFHSTGDCIYNGSSGKAFKMSLNKDRIPHYLQEGMSQSLKIAIIHLVLVHLRDSNLLKKVGVFIFRFFQLFYLNQGENNAVYEPRILLSVKPKHYLQ